MHNWTEKVLSYIETLYCDKKARRSVNDDQFDKLVTIKTLGETAGEHGPHAIFPTADGEGLYVVMGNQTQLPEDYTRSTSKLTPKEHNSQN